ncbi:ubiquitin-protein ligase [Trametes versicolor FP-101664 SS1]|uniref:ubiquitin-protein ligase n=1 Tax=Trametes versicolor (strain FP-101664) TaxID=717944 RepID=UPI000462461F|nr:ubiquitin-protein ligase [Trametes versicolor FP-101664 SS1]EIW59111.1 ubiquitin-protein ligase [Trametes versicolor FP-101664 SS1]
MLLENFLEDMRRQQYLIEREVAQYMAEYENSGQTDSIVRLIFRLVSWYVQWKPIAELGLTIHAAYTLVFRTHIFSIFPPSFSRGFKELIASTFSLVSASSPPPWLIPADLPPIDPPPRPDYQLWIACETLGLLERYESLISSVCYEYIEAHVLETCAKKWDEPMLPKLREWMTEKIVPWMIMPYARGARSAEEARAMLQGVGSRFDYHVCKTLCDLRIQEIFDIIIDFPDSQSALLDLKVASSRPGFDNYEMMVNRVRGRIQECLQRVDQRSQLVINLRKANKKRLLHPGADTKDILTQYVSIIRCLRIIDPPGVLLYKVADPIRKYLRERSDTIRCIVASLVGDGESGDSLVDENEPIQPLQQMQADDFSDPNWEPEPIDAGPDFRTNKPSDVISTLVSIYDSKDLFVKELQVLLTQRLLAVKDGNYERERRNIEILKVRFGEAALQVCEVMLRDMTDSRRIDQHVQAQKAVPLHPTIISRHFWPPLQTNSFTMPGQFRDIQDSYAKEFHLFKPDKHLHWLSHLGTIKLDIELQDRTVSAEVPPLEASIVEFFSQKDIWTVDELVAELKSVEKTAIVKALTTWLDLGVLKEEDEDRYKLLEIAEALPSGQKAATRAAADEEAPALAVQQQQAEQMKVFWKFIEGMLTNLGALPLARIQTMLKFAPGYDQTIEQLAEFMEAARREGLVMVKDGMWKLCR